MDDEGEIPAWRNILVRRFFNDITAICSPRVESNGASQCDIVLHVGAFEMEEDSTGNSVLHAYLE